MNGPPVGLPPIPATPAGGIPIDRRGSDPLAPRRGGQGSPAGPYEENVTRERRTHLPRLRSAPGGGAGKARNGKRNPINRVTTHELLCDSRTAVCIRLLAHEKR